MDSNPVLSFSSRSRYIFVIALTLLPIVSLMLLVFLVSYRPVFYSFEHIIDAQLQQIQPVHHLQLTLTHALMPPNDYLIHGADEEKAHWKTMKQAVKKAFHTTLNSKGLADDHKALESLNAQWDLAQNQGDILMSSAGDGCRDPEMAVLMEEFEQNVGRITNELHVLVAKKEKVISSHYAEIDTLKTRGLIITGLAISAGLLLGIIGSIWITREGKKLKDLSLYDPLTRIYNRKALDSHLSLLNRHQINDKIPHFSVLLIDIDKFKNINDTYGHDAGDLVLKSFAQRIQNIMRTNDIFGRFGGEEFLVLLPSTSKEKAEKLAQRIRKRISSEPVCSDDEAVSLTITASIGVSTLPDDATTISDLLKAADTAMYQAKQNGRNQVVCAP